ncbi:hypothetical protein Y919_01110 [Caloranaerobacter azorensis H53214]|uniref:Uncharacterized protein n=1 Tax=Caloranaerobacter azorensis H53214 TaxID=1156417 RepID=A0A096BKS5_9FIRM|nr:hypothetical protein Y919_01110 [Caloranaerobacter azorensis H53214]
MYHTKLKKFTTDFKEVYTAINEEIAYSKLQEIEEKWGKKYLFAIKSSGMLTGKYYHFSLKWGNFQVLSYFW